MTTRQIEVWVGAASALLLLFMYNASVSKPPQSGEGWKAVPQKTVNERGPF